MCFWRAALFWCFISDFKQANFTLTSTFLDPDKEDRNEGFDSNVALKWCTADEDKIKWKTNTVPKVISEKTTKIKRRQRKKSLALSMAAQLSKTNKLFWEETESWPEQEFFLTRTEVCRRVWGTKTSELPEGSMKFCRLGGRFPYSGAKEWHRTSSHVSKTQMVKSCFFPNLGFLSFLHWSL